MPPPETIYANVNRAFTTQSHHYDEDDRDNIILQQWRSHVYRHVEQYLRPKARILELNAGTGIDAVYFALKGNAVLATDLSDGMVGKISEKIADRPELSLRVHQLSFENISELQPEKFDYVFSNFGGLNCAADLSHIAQQLPNLLNEGAYITWVIMPRLCPWEIARVLKGDWKIAFRRWSKDGTVAHLDGAYFKAYYFSVREGVQAFPPEFSLVQSQGLGIFSPPPASNLMATKSPRLFSWLHAVDDRICNTFPFNRWGDHVILTFQYHGSKQ